MPLHVPVSKEDISEEVWAYVTRILTNLSNARATLIDHLDVDLSTRLASADFDARLPAVRAALIDNLDVVLSTRLPTATFDTRLSSTRAARIDEITAARMAELDPANLPSDINTLLTRLTAARAGYLNNINNAQLLNLPNVSLMEHEIEFPSAELMTVVVATGESVFSEQGITVSLPAGATVRRALVLGLVTALNDTANAQKIDIDVQGRKGAGSWSTFFSEDDVIGFGAVDGATTSLVTVQDVSALVDEAEDYGFRFKVNQSAAQSVRYTTQFIIVVTYRMS